MDTLFWVYALIFGGIIITLGSIHYLTGYDAFNSTDIFNWTSLVVEAGLGIGITYTVWFLSKRDEQRRTEVLITMSRQQDEISKLVNTITDLEKKQDNLLKEQEKSNELRKKNAMNTILMYLKMFMLPEALYHREMLIKFYDVDWRGIKSEVSDNESTAEWIKMIKEQTIRRGEDLKLITLTAYDVLDPKLLKDLVFLQSFAVKPFDLSPEQAGSDLTDCDALIDWSESILKEFFNETDESLKFPSANPK